MSQSQPILRVDPALSAALGGVPTRPPAHAAPAARYVEPPELAARRTSFTAAALPPAPAPPLGHAIFDAPPRESRELVDGVRVRLAALARHILAECEALAPRIAELDTKEISKAEGFDARAATEFLRDLRRPVDALTAPSQP